MIHLRPGTGSLNPRAFTLVETLVAVAVITLAVLAPFAAMQKVISASRAAKDNLIAASLVQEALEYARFVRMDNYIAHYPNDLANYQPMAGLDGQPSSIFGTHDCRAPNNACTIDGTASFATAIAACGSSCTALRLTADGLYTQSSMNTSPTPYTRTISIDESHAGYEIVTARVSWNDHGTARSVILTENLYDWL